MADPTAHVIAVVQAAHDALETGESCRLLSAASSEPRRDAQATRVGDTVIVTAEVTVTYVYQVYREPREGDDGSVDSG